MALNKRQASLLNTLLSKGVLDKQRLGSMKAPKITQAPIQNRKTDYASYLLSGALNDKGVGRAMSRSLASNVSAEDGEQSFITQLLDTMLIPNYTVANMAQSIGENLDDPLQALKGLGKDVADAGHAVSSQIFGRGLTKLPFVGDKFEEAFERSPFQQEKRTFSDNLGDMGVENNIVKHGLGMGLDIALDPLTYIGGLGVGNRLRGAGKLGKSAADTLTDKAAIPEAFLKPQVKLAKPSVARRNPLEEIESYEKWLKSEIKKVRQRSQVSPGHFKYSRKDGQRISSLERELRHLMDTGSDAFFEGRGLSKLDDIIGNPALLHEFRPRPYSVAEDVMKGGTVRSAQPATQMPQLPRQDVKSLVDPIDQGPGQIFTRKLQRRFDRRVTETPLPKAFDQPNFKDLTERAVRRQKDWERSMTKLGKITEGTKLNMAGANKVVQEIAAGRVPRVLPQAPKVTDDLAERAKDIADDVIDSMMGQKKTVTKKNTLIWRTPDGRTTSRKLPPELTAGMQISMANKIFTATDPKTIDEAIGVLRAAEDHMIALGVHPVRHEGVRVRLSDVMNLLKPRIDNEIPFETIMNNFARKNMKDMDPAVREAIQTVAAYRSATMADILENLTTQAQKAKSSVLDNYVGRQKSAAEAKILDESIAAAAASGMTKGELQQVKNLIRDVIQVDKIPMEKFYTEASQQLTKAFHEGRVSGDIIMKFNKMVANFYGYTAENLASKVTGNRVVDTLMGAFLTHHGKGHLFPKAQGLFQAGEQIAGARAQALRIQARKYSKEEIKNAWKVVTSNADEAVTDPRVMEMANWFRGYFDEVLKVPKYAMKLENPATKHLSVAERSMTLMKDVNRHLKDMGSSFQFTSKNFQRDAWGMQRHFGKEHEGWTASWAMADPDDPLKLLYDIDLAMERATREYAFLDNFVDVFGSLSKDGYHNFKMARMARIADFYVPKEIGQQMTRIMDDIHKGHWRPRTPLTNFYTQGLRAWKSSVTIYMPSHHIRNGIGDMYLMWMAGHNNPLAFKYALRVMHSQKGRYQAAIKSGDFQTLSNLTDPDAVKLAATQGKDVILNVNGTKVTAEQLYVNAFHRGLLKDANRLEDIFGETKLPSPFGGRIHQVPAGAAEYREHYIRLSHFISAVNKGLKRGRKDLDSLFDDAANEVRKWHPDGTDLTYFEEKYLRQVIPFYSWLRKSTPLLVESLVTRPSKTLAYPRGMAALQNMMGIDASVSDPFPDDQLFPEWLRESGIGPIGDPKSDNPFVAWWGNLGRNMIDIEGNPYGYTFINPSNPFIDQMRATFGFGGTSRDMVKGLFDQASPALKIPYELGVSGREFTGAPIYPDEGGRGVGQYLLKQHGATAPLQRYLDVGEKEREGVEPQKFDLPAFLNNLTALGIYGSGPYIKSAEFEEKKKIAAQKRKEAEK